jgi:hypothetical protein
MPPALRRSAFSRTTKIAASIRAGPMFRIVPPQWKSRSRFFGMQIAVQIFLRFFRNPYSFRPFGPDLTNFSLSSGGPSVNNHQVELNALAQLP